MTRCALILLVAGLAACEPAPPPTPTREAIVCDANDFAFLLEAPIEDVNLLITDLRLRVLGPDDFVTRDFDPNRINFTTTPEGTVGRIFCG